MSYGSNSARYLENEVMSRPREWLVPLLYEHVVTNLRRAQVHIETGDLEGKANALSRASAILLELAGTLDMEHGGDIAARLASLYTFYLAEIQGIGRSLDTVRLDKLIGMIAELHEAWVQAAEQVAPRARVGGMAVGA